MAKKTYIGIADKAEKVKKIYIGVDGVARKVKAAYIGVNGVAKKIFASGVAEMAITYTGKYTDQVVTMGNGLQYRLLTLTSSGKLTLGDACDNVGVWLCSGGNVGGDTLSNKAGDGGIGGEFGSSIYSNLLTAVVIVAAGGNSSSGGGGGYSEFRPNGQIDNSFTLKEGAEGGTGATMYNYGRGGAAPLESTQPFKDSYFTSYPCAGGGGGSGYNTGSRYGGGGGGSSLGRGEDGGGGTSSAAGGITGGGKGGDAGGSSESEKSGHNATYYGSGGGGGAIRYAETHNGGNGYQGVVFVRIPLNQ